MGRGREGYRGKVIRETTQEGGLGRTGGMIMAMDRETLKKMHPKDIRELIRKQEFTEHTMAIAEDYTQANLAIVPRKFALQFMIFCQRNPKPCPVLEVTEPGIPTLRYLSDSADLRTDIPQYRVFKNGECVDEPFDIAGYWRDDLVAFLLGCSATFDHVLNAEGIYLRHFEQGKVPPVFITNIQCEPAGPFKGPMVVTERPIKISQLDRVIQICSRYPLMHGTPVHYGDPKRIGIEDPDKVDWGDRTVVLHDEIPVFWACGVTPQTIAMNAKLDLMITHYPAKMFLTDRQKYELATFS
jgi:uncharacterized protein YcsI (UPF0317 family)